MMLPIRPARAAVALLLVALASCGELSSPTATRPATSDSPSMLVGTILDAPVTAVAIQRDQALASSTTVSKAIGLLGGSLSIPGAGVTLVVPPGALARTTTISITSHPGRAVAYTFAPHGTKFVVPVILWQDLGATSWSRSSPSLFAAYFEDGKIDLATGVATVTEVLDVTVNLGLRTVRFPIGHFSGYMVASGSTKGSTTTVEQ